MENPGCEDEHKVTGLVDYSSSSDDDDNVSNEPSPSKRQHASDDDDDDDNVSNEPSPSKRLTDSGSETLLRHHGYPNSDSEEKDKMDAVLKALDDTQTFYSESDEDDTSYIRDTDVLRYGPYSWRRGDRSNGKEVYCVNLYDDLVESPMKESTCLELLDEIGCRERYLGCSVELDSVFFANLNKHEAGKMKVLGVVCQVVPYRHTVTDIW